MSLRAFLTAALAAFLGTAAAACNRDDPPTVPASALPRIVLQPSDLAGGFLRFDEGRLVRADMHAGPREDPERFGRTGGWKARYRQDDADVTEGPLVVESRADVFEGEDGAARDLEAYRSELESDGNLVETATIGEETWAAVVEQPGSASAVVFYSVAWRQRNVTASVLVSGFEGKLDLEDALALARKQERRIERAAG